MEIDDAGAQHVTLANDSVGYEGFSSPLQSVEQLTIHRIEMAVRGFLSYPRP